MSPHEKDVADQPLSGIIIHNGVPNVSSVLVENHPIILPVGHIPPTVELDIALLPLIILLKYTEKTPHAYSPGGGLLGTAWAVPILSAMKGSMRRDIGERFFIEERLLDIE